MHEIVKNDRIIGGITNKCAIRAQEIYKIFVEGKCIVTNARTAEMCKLAENSFRDVNIAFANELSLVCDHLDINVWELINLSNYHPRVDILQPGPGVGGHCIAVDPWFIVDSAPEQAKLIRVAREVNDSKPKYVIKKVADAVSQLGKKNNEISIAILGLAFKANVDDLRESPAVKITKELLMSGFRYIYIVEPNINKLPQILQTNTNSLARLGDAIKDADLVVLLVDHVEFKNMDVGCLVGKQVIDTCGVWSKS